ncbi:MAG: TRAP transporter small permease [Oscillospiraceae bacterium]
MQKVLHFLDKNIEKIICVACLALMSIIIVAQVFFRYVLKNSISWSEEIARYLFIWLIYIGISYGVKMDRHISVDAVCAMLPEKVQRYFIFISDLLFLTFATAVIYYGIQVVGMINNSGQFSPASHIPMGIIYSSTVVGFSLVVVRLIQNLIRCAKDIHSDAHGKKEDK